MYTVGPPIIIFISNHTVSLEGNKVNLMCSAINDVDANHTLQINWYKGNKLVIPNGRKHIYEVTDKTSRQLNSTLLFDPVKRHHEANYTCQAFNRNDSFSESKTNLTVLCTI